jgi:hypothetical protein
VIARISGGTTGSGHIQPKTSVKDFDLTACRVVDEHKRRARRTPIFEPAVFAPIDLDQFACLRDSHNPSSTIHFRSVSRETLTPSFLEQNLGIGEQRNRKLA